MRDTVQLNVEINDLTARTEILGISKDVAAATVKTPGSVQSVTTLREDVHSALATRTDSVAAVMKEKMDSYYSVPDNVDEEDAFFVGDMGEVIRQHIQWKEMLPRVEPFYAMKCCPDPMVIKTLATLGTGFDCASRTEIETALEYGVDPSKIIYANPCKQTSHIRYAAAKGVHMMTFDNADELRKIKQHMPNAQLVVRILGSDGSRSLCNLGLKFGAPPAIVPSLLQVAKDLELNVIGVSFHVGSGCFDAQVFGDAVKAAAGVIEVAKDFGFEFSMLDIGGGFPCNGASGLTFKEIVSVLRPAIDDLIPSHIRVIAEPGRYYAASAFTLAVNVVARLAVQAPTSANDHPAFMYYINDGMYGSFNCITFDHQICTPRVLAKNGTFMFGAETTEPEYPCSIWGPTCDSIDCITKEGSLPELNVGDWMYFDNMGAYTLAAASRFNGFKKTVILYTNTYKGHN
ncbi:ornithine decarboxylase [Rhizoclosmatium globosum]|uniref:ornithine decarboxylase n=1 Tax=Rhizoclosmatium globosum TaxID=329046 RepID=A0A1Y2B3K7_9FUNG|nr:ornithine decarboxylase [Rhizoclosmatium globosum]|eukprot:ORY29411.1 ornithine decarboxylase [Rhizoclosmatium globosum]